MLARRELSEAQIRQRLARRSHSAEAIDEVVARLREQRVLDDARTAASIARTQVSRKRRGERRVRQQIEQAGIAPTIARQAAREAAETVDPDALIESSLAKRLRERQRIASDAEFVRLYRYLIGQGFEADRVLAALKRRKGPTSG